MISSIDRKIGMGGNRSQKYTMCTKKYVHLGWNKNLYSYLDRNGWKKNIIMINFWARVEKYAWKKKIRNESKWNQCKFLVFIYKM